MAAATPPVSTAPSRPAGAEDCRIAAPSSCEGGWSVPHNDRTAAARASASSRGSAALDTTRMPGFAAAAGSSSAVATTWSNSAGTRRAVTSRSSASSRCSTGRGGALPGAQSTPDGSPTHSTVACRNAGGMASTTPSSGLPVPASPTTTHTTAVTMSPPISER
ncbi:hypothetical protein ADL03_07405 [Nocardia sp. NRRL S-836]|nr:hypothetical protein ADL03_07405 [Nocardia sp. NRRL S-836]